MALDMQAAVKIKATVDGLASVEGLERGLNKLDRQATGLQGNFGRLRGIAGGLGSALGSVVPAIGLAGLAAFGKRSIDAADNLNDLNQRTGVAVETLDKFGKAANDSGSSLDEVAKAMGKLAKGIVDPASKASEALKSIGVSSTDAQGKIRGVDAIMLDLADKFSKMPDGVQKTALAMELFGKSGSNIIPMLNEGKDALNEYSATIDGKMAAAADKFNDSINKVTASISGPFNEAITALLPTITKLAEGIAAAATGFSKLPQPIKEIVVAVGGLALAFNLLAPVIKGVVGLFGLIGGLKIGATIAGFAPALLPVIAGLKTLGEIIVAIFTGPVGWVALLIAAGVAIYLFRDKVGEALNAIVELYKQFFTMVYENFVKPYMEAHFALTRFIVDSFIKPTQEALSSFATAAYEYININFIEPTKALFSTVTTYINENFIIPVQTAILNFATVAYEYINATFIEPTKALFSTVTTYIKDNFVKPVQDTINGMIKNISTIFQSVKDAITRPFQAAMQTVRGIVNSILNGISNAMGAVVSAINNVIQGANRALAKLKMPQIPSLPQPRIPRFAEGGVVDGPTLAMVGEGSEREYIIPESKMAKASANYMAGARGGAVIPAFANGGVVGPSRIMQGSSRSSSPTIQIQTGPVLQQNNQQYVTIADMEKALTMLTDSLLLNNRTFGGRSYQGVGA
jgi:phage-related protein